MNELWRRGALRCRAFGDMRQWAPLTAAADRTCLADSYSQHREHVTRPMGNGKRDIRIKGFSDARMERLRRFTRALNAELALLGAEPLDVIEAHTDYQGLIDDHEGTWADLVRRLAAERTRVAYADAVEAVDEDPEPFEEGEGVPAEDGA